MRSVIIMKSPLLGGVGAFDGHMYELIEYAYILRSKFNVSMYITRDLYHPLVAAIRTKYTFTEDVISELISTIVIYSDVIDNPDAIILNVDGYLNHYITHMVSLNVHDIISFRCFATTLNTIDLFCAKYHVTLLADSRIYDNNFDNVTCVHYVKKILLQMIKPPTCKSNKVLLYFNNVCKKFDISQVIKHKAKGPLYIIGPSGLEYLNVVDYIEFGVIPVDNLFDKFGIYVYTGTSNGSIREDCSCRFLCECSYFDKHIIIDCEYDLDNATRVRLSDCEDINQLILDYDDAIFGIL